MKFYKFLAALSVCLLFSDIFAQSDKKQIRKIYDEVLTKGEVYENLRDLCKPGGRLSGSKNLEEAVVMTKELLEGIADTTYLQEVMVPHWERGPKEQAELMLSNGTSESLSICALGFSVGTEGDWLEGEVIEVFDIHELENLGDAVKDKIVFYNRPMEPTEINTFHAYSGCVDQRSSGATTCRTLAYNATVKALDKFPQQQ